MARSSSEISRIIRARLKVLDPDISAEPGTPERKIIDTVSETIAEAEIDQFVLDYQYDIDTKVGDDLDRFVSLFGFARQGGRQSTGTITFSRASPATVDIFIPLGTQIVKPATSVSPAVVYLTSASTTIFTGGDTADAPIQAVDPGEAGNAPANSIITFGSGDAFGISEVTNAVATSGGSDPESDAELRVRFKNTVFRNVAGTRDQFLALATSSRFTKKANVIGPMSRFSEYIQIPDSPFTANTQLGTQGFAKYIYGYDFFLSNGDPGNEIFYSPSGDFTFAPTNPGGGAAATSTVTGVFASTTLAANFIVATDTTITLTSGTGFGTSGTVKLGTTEPPVYANYTSRAGAVLSGVTAIGSGTILSGTRVVQGTLDVGQTYLLEQTYTSMSSRNDPANNIMMYVDIFASGEDDQEAVEQLAFPPTGNAVVNVGTTRFRDTKYYRDGTSTNPTVGNWLQFPANQPIISLPTSITIGANTWVLGTHYWLIKDITTNIGSRRGSDGIEWSSAVTTAVGTQFLLDYIWNRVPLAVNEIVDTYKAVTQDVLVHAAWLRYFNVYITIMYSSGFSPAAVEAAVFTALSDWIERQNFGALIQLADITNVIADVSGVDAVRIAKSTDDATNYGIREINKAGTGFIGSPYTNDFGLLDSQLPILNNVIFYRRAQNTWTF
jgi:uncharacterized phage protein gp47/JayE